MTPGFAKPREQLPWLYYPESNRVIINAHNFTPATNGLGDERVWLCPSRDDVGNSTATAYNQSDFAGPNGALTNMVPASDWIADTANGGVRAIRMDGDNDLVSIGTISASLWTISVWIYPTAITAAFQRILGQASYNLEFAINSGGILAIYDGAAWRTFGSALTLNTWCQVACTYDGTSLRVYKNGSQIGSTTAGGRALAGASNIGNFVGGFVAGNAFTGRWDDFRILNRVATGSEITRLAVQRNAP